MDDVISMSTCVGLVGRCEIKFLDGLENGMLFYAYLSMVNIHGLITTDVINLCKIST